MKRLVRNLTTSAETKTRQNMRLSQDHYREQNRDPRALLAFLPVFPTPLPPITAILMARPGLGYSAAGHSAIVVMFWMRRMFPLVSSVQTQEEEKNPKCWRAASGRKGEFNPVALPLLFREDSQLKAGGGCCCCCGARAAFIALERRSNLIGRGWSPPTPNPPPLISSCSSVDTWKETLLQQVGPRARCPDKTRFYFGRGTEKKRLL